MRLHPESIRARALVLVLVIFVVVVATAAQRAHAVADACLRLFGEKRYVLGGERAGMEGCA